jgi:2-polyprenyl-3-methyl-5-hydroxy-6-metoxy-1,4-benzoquinol methylase
MDKAMILDEAHSSMLEGLAIKEEMDEVAYKGTDNRPVWVGPYMPMTPDPGLSAMASWARTHYKFYLAFVERFMDKKGIVLDIGCGAGQYTAMLARYAATARGLDHDTKAIDFAKKHNRTTGATFRWGNFPHAIKPSERFDYLFCIETMEHVWHDEQMVFLKAAFDVLSPDGMLFITTPNEQTSSGPHIGIWNTEHRKKVADHFGESVLYKGFISNQEPEKGFNDEPQSHLVLVVKK